MHYKRSASAAPPDIAGGLVASGTGQAPHAPAPRARRWWRRLRRACAALLALVLLLACATYFYFRLSLPSTSGAVRVDGLSGPVEIVRDRDAVPHVAAGSARDAMFGLGYVHAQDRLWQMEFQRRVAQGRLSEIMGRATLSTDRFMRTIGISRAARAAAERLPADARETLDAYAAGINACIDTLGVTGLPPEFTLLRATPERWAPVDVLSVAKLMAFTLGGNFAVEAFWQDLARLVGEERAHELLPPSSADDITIVGDPSSLSGALGGGGTGAAVRRSAGTRAWTDAALSDRLRELRLLLSGHEAASGIGSNAWVVGGGRSASGKPVLANDVHLAAQTPSTWYLAHVEGGALDVIGATVPGLPAVVIGRNRSLAWGVTNLYADTQDLFRERFDADGRVEFEGRMEPVRVVSETIAVKGASPVEHTVRWTRHGPVISDATRDERAAASGQPQADVALRATMLDDDDGTVAALLRVNAARTGPEFTDALRGFVAPALGFVYADVHGNIGFYGAGRFPIRRAGDGSVPAEGWSGAHEWIGWVPAGAAPQVRNPAAQIIVAANNRPVPATYPYAFGTTWERPYRAQRIDGLLRARQRLGVDEIAALQHDTVSLEALELVPRLVELAGTPGSPRERAAIDLLRGWDGDMAGESVPAAIFAAWSRHLANVLVADELGRDAAARYLAWTDLFVTRFVALTLRTRHNPWCDDVRTAAREDCAAAVRAALAAAVGQLESALGGDPREWRWNRLHTAVFSHQPLGFVPVLRSVVNRSVATGGGTSTINVGPFNSSFTQRVVAGYRQVIDLAGAASGRFILAPGQSGHPLSAQYDAYLDDWRGGRYRAMRLDIEAAHGAAAATLRLDPASAR